MLQKNQVAFLWLCVIHPETKRYFLVDVYRQDFFFKHSTQATPIIIEQNSSQTAMLKYPQVELGGHIFQKLITELGGKEKYIKLLKEN